MENIKFNIVASQDKSICLYKNTRSKLLNFCTNIYVNRGDPTVHLTTLLIESVFFEGLKMT